MSLNNTAILKILSSKQLQTLLQPIVDLRTGEPIGYEALTRGPTGDYHYPSKLFKCAKEGGLLRPLEKACFKNAFISAGNILAKQKMFINVTPSFIEDLLDLDFLGGEDPSRIVFEITEQVPVENFRRVSDTCKILKRKGFLIAIDDVGSGYDRLRSVAELKPDYIKIDQPIVSSSVDSKQYQIVIKHLVALAAEIKCSVIAEGIETSNELLIMRSLGVSLGQGYLFSAPSPVEQIGVELLCQVRGL